MQADHASSTDSAPPAAALLSILLPLPLAGPYDYRADIDLRLERGDFVIVPLGSREVIGVVWGEGSGDVGTGKLRDVVARLEARPLPEVLCRFVEWVAQYTMTLPGTVLAMVMRVPAALEPPRAIAAWRRSDDAVLLGGLRLTAERRRVLDVLADGPPRPTIELAREAGVGVGVVKALAATAALAAIELPPPPAFEAPHPERAGPTLSTDQPLPRQRFQTRSRPAPSRSRSSTASPAPARPRSISRRSRQRYAVAGKRSCCCRRSHSARNGSIVSPPASVCGRRNGIPI